MLVAENITYRAGKTTLLSEVSAELPYGSVTAILGPNGAGKTTLLSCLAGALRPQQGCVTLDGTPLAEYSLTALARKRAVLSQSHHIAFPFTVGEVVAMGRNPYQTDTTAAADARIARAALAQLEAETLIDRDFATLSGGEQQRVQLARVLAQLWQQREAHLFLDEPTSALDLKHQHQLLQLARQYAQQQRWAVTVILHDPQLAKRYADRVIYLKPGHQATTGPAEQMLTPEYLEEIYEIDSALLG